jgi:hypothetical protein
MKYVVKMNFNLSYCGIIYLDSNPEHIHSDAFIKVDNGLFLKERRVRLDGNLVSYLYEADGKYTKKVFGKKINSVRYLSIQRM